MLHEAIALFLGLFFVAQVWLAIFESRVGPFASHWFRGGVLLVSVAAPIALVVLPATRVSRRSPFVASRWSIALLVCVLASAAWLFESIQPFYPDHDDTFRAGFVHAIWGTGFPPALRWWTAAATGHVRYYVLVENIVAQVATLIPRLSIFWLYVHQLKLAYLACNVLLGFSIARELGALSRLVIPNRVAATVCEMLVAWCAFLMLVFGATPFDLATLHLLAVSQSAIVHTVLLLFIALVMRRRSARGWELVAIDLSIWTLPAVLVTSKFPFVPAFTVALGIHWLLDGTNRTRGWRAFVLPVYFLVSTALAMTSVGLVGAAEKHPLAWLPLRLFHELAPHWFHFSTWPLFLRVATAFGLYDAPIFLLVWFLMRSHVPLATRLRSPNGRAFILVSSIMLVGYAASATIGFADREGANELYWFVQGWSALSVLVFLAILSAPASRLKLAIVPFALFSVHSNWSTLRHSVSDVYGPLETAAVEACGLLGEWATATDDRANSVVAHPFGSWDFAACSALPTVAPPVDRYDRFAREDPLLAPSRAYLQQLLSVAPLPAPPVELRPSLGRFAHILVIRPRGRPLVDPTASLIGQRGELLYYDWPTRIWR